MQMQVENFEDGCTDNVENQRKCVRECANRQLVVGDTWYLVSLKWFESLKEHIGLNDSLESEEAPHPGPIDNSDILDCDGTQDLKEHLLENLDFALVPEDVWDLLIKTYGILDDQKPIGRQVVNLGQFANHLTVEIDLMEFVLSKDFDFTKTVKHKFSKKATTTLLHDTARKLFDVPKEIESQLWSCIPDSSYQFINVDDNSTLMEELVYPSAKIVLDTKGPDGEWSSSRHGVKRDTKDSMSTIPYRKETYKNAPIALPAPPVHGTSPSMTTRYSVAHSSVTPGLCGLSNLGNTCFMNSVLQCMSNTPPITDYFLNDYHVKDLNVENPLGMRGEIAKSFGDLIKVMWSGTSLTIPHHFKLQVSKFAPQFSGYQQHDAQELLTFLLDGLHEDLNRIHDKPYIKQRDSDGRPDEIVAAEAWSNYKKRNDSIIVELFHGLLKSTVWCPHCKIMSVTFDPLCYLSLPLPTKLERYFDVIFYPYSEDKKPTQYKVLVPQKAKMEDVFKALNKLTSYPINQMIATEIVKNHFQKIFDPYDCVDSFFEDRDILHVYQVPVSVDDKQWICLPVCQWELGSSSEFAVNQLFGLPVFVVIPREGCTYMKLFKAILERMAPYLAFRGTGNPTYNNYNEDSIQYNGGMKDEENNDDEDEDEDDDSEGKPNNSDGHDELMDIGVEYSGSGGTDLGGEDWDKDEDGDCMYMNGDSANQNSSFRIFIVNNHKLRSLHAPDMSSKLTFPAALGRQYLVVQWTSATRRSYFKDSVVSDIEKHESVHGYSRPSGVDLKDCLNLYTSTEKLDASEAWYCPKCKDHIEATKKFDLWNLPRILVIHLKRFQYNRFRRDKIDTTVHFPLRNLDLRDYVSDPNYQKSTIYDLIGVCNHYGNLAGGHYTAYGLNKVEKAWYLFDDNHVRRANPSSVVTNSAYVLFYMRRDVEEMKH